MADFVVFARVAGKFRDGVYCMDGHIKPVSRGHVSYVLILNYILIFFYLAFWAYACVYTVCIFRTEFIHKEVFNFKLKIEI